MTLRIKKYNVYIILKTGLHIGKGNNNIAIGEMDNPVIKDKNGFPYIPGSSLKGKLRSLYEISEGKIGPDGGPYEFDGEKYDEVSMFFGKAGKTKGNLENLGPTRFIFRDLKLAKKEDLNNLNIESFETDNLYTLEDYEIWRNSGEELTEEKYENVIDRRSGTTKQGGLRQVERVFAGTVFKGELIVRFFEKPDKNTEEKNFAEFGKNLTKLKELLEDDYLGGMGSRGYGQIEIIFECIEGCKDNDKSSNKG